MIYNLVDELQELGYSLSLDGVNLHFRYGGAGDPPERAGALLEQLKAHKTEVVNYLRLLQTPQAKLERPIPIESGYLKDTFYVVANENQAGVIEKAGGVCYLPEEIRTLLANSIRMDKEILRDYLSKVHAVKRTFPGARIGGVQSCE